MASAGPMRADGDRETGGNVLQADVAYRKQWKQIDQVHLSSLKFCLILHGQASSRRSPSRPAPVARSMALASLLMRGHGDDAKDKGQHREDERLDQRRRTAPVPYTRSSAITGSKNSMTRKSISPAKMLPKSRKVKLSRRASFGYELQYAHEEADGAAFQKLRNLLP